MPYCVKCGQMIGDEDSFCQACGNRIATTPVTVPTPITALNSPPVSLPDSKGSENALAIVPDLMRNQGFGRKDCYYLMVTPKRSIFIKLSSPIMQNAAQYNLNKNPAQNKSIWSRWKAQVAGPNIYLQYFNSLTPQQALSESAENFEIVNAQINKVKCTFIFDDEDPSEWRIEFQSAAGVHKFVTASNPEKLLKAGYAEKFTK